MYVSQISGTDSPETLEGTDGNDILYGAGGDDILHGKRGNDILTGGDGSDTADYSDAYKRVVVDLGIQDVKQQTFGGGWDILSTIENVKGSQYDDALKGTDHANILDGGAGNDQLYGYGGDDTLIGGSGRNYLDGGTGNDTMINGSTYVVDSLGDVVIDSGKTGGDTVLTSVDFTMGMHVSRLEVTTDAGVHVTGNSLANVIEGGDGNDTIIDPGGNNKIHAGAGNDHIETGSGSDVINGGTGADYMAGGLGWDLYYVDNVKDVVVEVNDGGNSRDVVIASSDFTLGDYVEQLLLESNPNARNGFGNDQRNVIKGNQFDNELHGNGGDDLLDARGGHNILRGGSGNDKLIAGDSSDTFVFEAASINGHDRLVFQSGIDHLQFASADYGFEPGHLLTNDEFHLGSRAVGTGPQFFYNERSHVLFFDADGVGGEKAVALATMAQPTVHDFIIA